MKPILEVNKLTKNFGRLCAVNGMDLTVEAGQVFGMLGPNGSGKTTTLGMLMGVINPTSGNFTWFGEVPTHLSRRKIGAVLEHPIFYPYLSGQKNLELTAMIKGANADQIREVLELVELADRKHDKYKTYSLGMKQRLAIASALLNDPQVLILDEPTNGLDPMGIAEIRELILKIAADGKTIILASHLLDEVQKVCTHFAVLKKGNMVYNGPVAGVSEGAEVVEVNAEVDEFEKMLKEFNGTASVAMENGFYLTSLTEGTKAQDLNKYLVGKGVVATHLVVRKKSLEKQFLEILADSK
ncbi:MAG: ATP-binding cassette domain-containing protein [Cyclobacteriaceae bacterium]